MSYSYKKEFLHTELCFRDVHGNLYNPHFFCSCFPSILRIEDVAFSVLEDLPDNNIVWSSFKVKMRFVNLLVPSKNV